MLAREGGMFLDMRVFVHTVLPTPCSSFLRVPALPHTPMTPMTHSLSLCFCDTTPHHMHTCRHPRSQHQLPTC